MLHIQGRGFFHLGSLVYISVQSPGGIFLSFLKQKKCTEANHSQNQKQNVEVKWKSDDISVWYVIVKTKNTCNWIVWQPYHSAPFKLPIQVRNENQIQNCILCPHLLNTCIFIHVYLYFKIFFMFSPDLPTAMSGFRDCGLYYWRTSNHQSASCSGQWQHCWMRE